MGFYWVIEGFVFGYGFNFVVSVVYVVVKGFDKIFIEYGYLYNDY